MEDSSLKTKVSKIPKISFKKNKSAKVPRIATKRHSDIAKKKYNVKNQIKEE